MLYLASPYSHHDPAVRELRYRLACQACVKLVRNGNPVYSSIVHFHPMATNYGLPTDWGFWRRFCVDAIRLCDGIVVIKIDGWDESEGVKAELDIGKQLGIPILFMEPCEFSREHLANLA